MAQNKGVWEQEEIWLFHKCLELLTITSLKLHCSSSLYKSLRRNMKKTDFFSPAMKKNDTASSTFLPCCLCFKSGEREMDAENIQCAAKKKRCIPKQNLRLKRHLTLTFIYRRLIKWLIYPKKQWKSVAMWHVKISDLNWKILRPNVRFL